MIFLWKTPIVADVRDIVLEVKHQGYIHGEITDVGQDLMIKCPFHKQGNERKASFGISTVDKKKGRDILPNGTCHCYTCGYTGDLVKFVADTMGFETQIKAYKYLVDKYNFGDTDERVVLTFDMSRDVVLKKPAILKSIVQKRVYDFIENSRAYDYMNVKRKISSEVLMDYEIGYNASEDRIMIPIIDLKGECLFFKERSIENKFFHNAKDIEKGNVVYGLYQLLRDEDFKPEQEVWLCESETDVLTVVTRGDYSIGQMGSHLSEQQIQILCSSPVRNIRDGLDRDSAGRKGWKRAKELLIPLGFRMWNTKWESKAKDINDLEEQEYINLSKF